MNPPLSEQRLVIEMKLGLSPDMLENVGIEEHKSIHSLLKDIFILEQNKLRVLYRQGQISRCRLTTNKSQHPVSCECNTSRDSHELQDMKTEITNSEHIHNNT